MAARWADGAEDSAPGDDGPTPGDDGPTSVDAGPDVDPTSADDGPDVDPTGVDAGPVPADAERVPSSGGATGSRADERRQRILAAAVTVFSRRGFRATSMRDVAAGVGLSKPAVYHYVSSKQDLLVQIYEEVLDESLAGAQAIVATAPTPLEAVRRLIVERVAYTAEHQDLLKICFEEESELPPDLAAPILERRRAFEAVVLGAVARHLDETGRTLPMAPKAFVNTCLGAANWVYKWYDPAGPRTPRELGEEVAAVLMPARGAAGNRPRSARRGGPDLSASGPTVLRRRHRGEGPP
jgi:TetR/AcrR family transcriptional regulator, cholesterol catabolism regulator